MNILKQLLNKGDMFISFKEDGRLLSFLVDKDTGEILKRWEKECEYN